ncbi:MAG: translation initiation factor [Candidatus Endonucleobacter sp. (ex Gigantidas childressi)]|nr:translation initiation factor [Candidatus Endonucleobacter sp. (ex Gigantidas childressi)]
MVKQNSNSHLVYSTDKGRIKEDKKKQEVVEVDANVRVWPEKKKRAGKIVTVIGGLPMTGNALKVFAKELKKRFGGGGSVKDSNIELQGDHVDVIVDFLKKHGYEAKRAGG